MIEEKEYLCMPGGELSSDDDEHNSVDETGGELPPDDDETK